MIAAIREYFALNRFIKRYNAMMAIPGKVYCPAPEGLVTTSPIVTKFRCSEPVVVIQWVP